MGVFRVVFEEETDCTEENTPKITDCTGLPYVFFQFLN